MSLPRIGVTSSSATGVTQAIETVGRLYLDGIAAAGGLPLVVPALDPALAADAVAGIDGLVLTGGGDVDPACYGAEREAACGPPNPARDAWELALVAAAREAGIPVLGICRGAQVLNVAYGGTLVQDLPTRTVDGHDDVARAAEEVHEIFLTAGTRLSLVMAGAMLRVNTLHHQAVDAIGPGLVLSARADDGVIEGIESPTEPVLGVQWHPELLLDRQQHRALFEWVVRPGGR